MPHVEGDLFLNYNQPSESHKETNRMHRKMHRLVDTHRYPTKPFSNRFTLPVIEQKDNFPWISGDNQQETNKKAYVDRDNSHENREQVELRDHKHNIQRIAMDQGKGSSHRGLKCAQVTTYHLVNKISDKNNQASLEDRCYNMKKNSFMQRLGGLEDRLKQRKNNDTKNESPVSKPDMDCRYDIKVKRKDILSDDNESEFASQIIVSKIEISPHFRDQINCENKATQVYDCYRTPRISILDGKPNTIGESQATQCQSEVESRGDVRVHDLGCLRYFKYPEKVNDLAKQDIVGNHGESHDNFHKSLIEIYARRKKPFKRTRKFPEKYLYRYPRL